ncbi:MAG: DinB family protein [Bacteroidota bacterium]
MNDLCLESLARNLDEAYGGPAWHGPTLTGALRGLSEEQAVWRPGVGRHNAWELAVHAAYWKYRVLRYVAKEPPERFSEPGSNFFERPAEGARLDADLETLARWHQRLTEAVRVFDPARLDEVAYDAYTFEALIRGAAAHDVYHAGQIRLLRRLLAG